MTVIYGISLLIVSLGICSFLTNWHKRPKATYNTYHVNVTAPIDSAKVAADLQGIIAKANRNGGDYR